MYVCIINIYVPHEVYKGGEKLKKESKIKTYEQKCQNTILYSVIFVLFIRFQASLHRDGNLEIYSIMIRFAVFGRFPSASQGFGL